MFTVISCSNDNNDNLEIKTDDPTLTFSRDVELTTLKNGKSVSSGVGQITVILDEATEEVVDYEISQNLLDTAGITLEEFGNLLEEDKERIATMKGAHSDCIEACKDKYEKNEGRGGCKANCWVDTAVEVLKAAGDIIGGLT